MKGINCSETTVGGKIKKVLSRAHVRSLEQRASNAHDQSEQTLCQNVSHHRCSTDKEDDCLRKIPKNAYIRTIFKLQCTFGIQIV